MTTLVSVLLVLVQTAAATDKLRVFVSIVPQKYFVEQIGGKRVEVQVMVKPGASPHTYEPKPRQMAALAKTGIYFAIGVSFEKVWLRKIAAANPQMKIVRTDQGIRKIPMATHLHEEDEEDEDDDRHDEHGSLDPHIWLSPLLVKTQAQHILHALRETAPAFQAEFESNYQRFIVAIESFDAQLREILRRKSGSQFLVFHPSWSYFASDYGLEQVSIEIEGKSPKPAQLKDLIEYAKQKRINVIFVQPQFSTRSAELIAREIGGQVVFADPLAANWMTNLRMIAAKFKQALR